MYFKDKNKRLTFRLSKTEYDKFVEFKNTLSNKLGENISDSKCLRIILSSIICNADENIGSGR